MDFENMQHCLSQSQKQNLSLCASWSTCFRFLEKMHCRDSRQCITAARFGRRPLRTAKLRLRRASFFFRGSSKYGGFAAAKPRILCLLSDTHSPFFFASSSIRSSPLEKLSPKNFSSNHIDSPPGEHYLRPVMDTLLTLGFPRPFFRRPYSAWCHPNTGTSLPLPCSTLDRKLRLGSLPLLLE